MRRTVCVVLFLWTFFGVDSCQNASQANQYVPAATAAQREDEYSRVIAFLNDPIKNFKDIQNIKDPLWYISITEKNSEGGAFQQFLSRHFLTINRKKARILIYLLWLEPAGEFGESLIDRIIQLFVSNPTPFLRELQERADWPLFIGLMRVGDYFEFVAAVKKLGVSGFEGEFRKRVLEQHLDTHLDPYGLEASG